MEFEISGTIGAKAKLDQGAAAKPYAFQILMFGDVNGRVVQHRKAISGSPPAGQFEFMGITEHDVKTIKGIARVPLQFPLPGATTIEEAFSFWDACKQMAAEQAESSVRAQVEGPAILTPGDPRLAGLRRKG